MRSGEVIELARRDLGLELGPVRHDHVVVKEGDLVTIDTIFEGELKSAEQSGHREL